MASGYYTYGDAIRQVLDWLGSKATDDSAVRDVRRAVLGALREYSTAHVWRFYFQLGRFNLNGPFCDGTIQYQISAGAHPYQVTLTGGTFPTWAADAYLRIGDVTYRVDQRIANNVVTLIPELSPPTDLAAGTSYILYQDTYLLPQDWMSQDEGQYERILNGIKYVHPREWLRSIRAAYTMGVPQCFTITDDAKYPNRLVARFFPIPQEARTLDFLYRRLPRPLVTSSSPGLVTIASGSSSLTGIGTKWNPKMVGSVIRFSADGVNPPTGPEGTNPSVFETTIASVTSSTSCTLVDSADTTYTKVMSDVSDPVDIELASSLTLFQRAMEWQISLIRNLSDKPNPRAAYDRALVAAKVADAPTFMGRVVGPARVVYRSIVHMPLGPQEP